jgi:hypothetical protein
MRFVGDVLAARGVKGLGDGAERRVEAVIEKKRAERLAEQDARNAGVTVDRPNDPHDDLTPGADPTDRAGVAPSSLQASDGAQP